jgi:hypothetical protein
VGSLGLSCLQKITAPFMTISHGVPFMMINHEVLDDFMMNTFILGKILS